MKVLIYFQKKVDLTTNLWVVVYVLYINYITKYQTKWYLFYLQDSSTTKQMCFFKENISQKKSVVKS